MPRPSSTRSASATERSVVEQKFSAASKKDLRQRLKNLPPRQILGFAQNLTDAVATGLEAGQEFLEDKQWADDVANHADKLLHWEGLAGEDPSMGDFHRFTREAIATRFRHAAFRAEGCRVIHVHNRNRVIAFQRWTPERGEDVVIVASLNSSTLYGYELGFPGFGAWTESFNSDVYDHWVNPQARGNGGGVHAWGDPRHAMPTSAQITIPANSVLVFSKA